MTSAFDANLIAAPTSSSPMSTRIVRIHSPALGRRATYRGASASRKNGSAKAAEYTSTPTTGVIHDPRDARTSRVPTEGAVQVTDVSVNVAPMRSAPNDSDEPAPNDRRLARLRTDDGSESSSHPNRFAAKTR